MSVKTNRYTRKSFDVEAVRVTRENFAEVAAWASGVITQSEKSTGEYYFKVEVKRPISERQTRAYIGDWILYAGHGFKVYSDRAFREHFQLSASQAPALRVRPDVFPGEPVEMQEQHAPINSNDSMFVSNPSRLPECVSHDPIQHGDGKPAWCDSCGKTRYGTVPGVMRPVPLPSDLF